MSAQTDQQDQQAEQAVAGGWAQVQALTTWYGPNRDQWIDAVTESIYQVVQ